MSEPENERVRELRALLSQQPGTDEFVELANILSSDPQSRSEAREICFKGLNDNPKNFRGRLTLARLFYLDGYGEFCIRELVELNKRVSLASLERLIELFGDFAKPFLAEANQTNKKQQKVEANPQSEANLGGSEESDSVVAEMDLDDEFLEALEDLENN